jgi:hypothetical protein
MDHFTKDAIDTLKANIQEVEAIIKSNTSTLINSGAAVRLHEILEASLSRLTSSKTDEKTKALLIDKLNVVYLMIPDLREG